MLDPTSLWHKHLHVIQHLAPLMQTLLPVMSDPRMHLIQRLRLQTS